MAPMKVLCTGGRGFVGRHLVGTLLGRGYEVWCLLGPGEEPDPLAEGEIRWIRGDVTNPASLVELRRPFSVIYHLAGLNTSSDRARLYRVNYEGTINVAAAILAGGKLPRRLLYTSSYAAMGPALSPAGLREETPCRPVSDYGKSKLMAELYLRSLRGLLPVTVVRLPLVYGPGSRGGLLTYFKLISRGFCPCLARGEATMGFVEDMAAGIVMAAENPKTEGEVYLLGDDRAMSLEEVLSCIEDAVGRKAMRIRIPRWAALKCAFFVEKSVKVISGKPSLLRQDVECFLKYPSWRADTSRARQELGFKARISFKEGAKITADWYRRNGFL